ncbi:fatty acyl-CoA reductase 3-like [Corylus avellana]|uniref:fatty acyl-CoA reductase 3-like n=1 Tax=Corylus avellana TaxID=13451 RepID=UPI00286CE32A|nr:fatty acyl-CoA reductase 3-like [Corylus avellana]
MELESIPKFLENKTILVTGATGFLAKAFVEKILRVQPDIKRLYLLIRASDLASATQRLHNEVIGKDLFRVVREKWGPNLDSFISEKVIAVPGDVSNENLGVKDSDLRNNMWNEIDIILNSAATTTFDERYDVALGINTFSALHVMGFARNCINLKVLLHVSTAYVCGEKKGQILESPFEMEETLNGSSRLDIKAEKQLVDEYLDKLRGQGATDRAITSTMKDLGIKRARLYGWPNTYVYTKAMGEMLLGRFRENLPLVIIRPTMVSSTYKEPFSGWIEGVRTIDGVVSAYGKGKLQCFLGHHETIFDIIPADMVVNCMIVAMVAYANQSSEIILHVGSSWRNPIKFSSFRNVVVRYFAENPLVSKNGKSISVGKVTVLSSMASFRAYMAIRYIIPLKVFQIANAVICQHYQDLIIDLNRKMKSVMRLAELYEPYVFFTSRFDDSNTEKLRLATSESGVDSQLFGFDPKCIDWKDYLMNTHIPGLRKYALKL